MLSDGLMMSLEFFIPFLLLLLSTKGLLNNHSPDELYLMVTNQSNSIQRLETSLKTMERIIVNQNKTIQNLSSMITQLQATVDLQNKTLEQIAAKHQTTSEKVIAFYAKLTNNIEHLADGQTIEFNKVVTNIGNVYDPKQGKFTVPIRGVYLISVSMMSRNDHDPLWCSLVKNGQKLTGLFSSSGGSFSDTQTIVVVLEVGDILWVIRNPGAPDAHTNPYNSYFAGYLITEHT